MSVWDSFYRLDYLDLAFVNNTSAQRAIIYGNSQNRIALSIKAKIVDKNNNPLVIPADELLRSAHLVKFRNGERLNWEGHGPDSKPWVYTRYSNDYTEVPSFDAVLTDTHVEPLSGEQEVIFYVYATDVSSGIDIAAGFNVPGVGDFNNSESGTNTRNGPKGASGSTFKNPKSIHLRAIPAISYDHGENVVIVKRETIQVDSFNWQSRYSVGGPYADHSNGQVWRGEVIFKPSKEIGVNPTFKKWEVNYTDVTNDTLNKDSINWGPDMHCFDAILDKPFPCAVMHRGAGRAESHVICWYPSIGGAIVINGHYILQDTNYYYKCSPYFQNTFSKSKHPAVQLAKFIVPENNLTQYGWRDDISIPSFKVTDNFGNTGQFSLKFNDSDHFDVPAMI